MLHIKARVSRPGITRLTFFLPCVLLFPSCSAQVNAFGSAQVNTFGGAITSEQAVFFMAHGVQLHQLHNGKISLYSNEEIADAQAVVAKWEVDIMGKLGAIANDVTSAVSTFANKASDVVSSLGNGPIAMEIRKEFNSLTSPQEKAQAAAMVNSTKEAKPEDVGPLAAALATASIVSDKLDTLCEIAGCIVDPDIVSCANVPPFRCVDAVAVGCGPWGTALSMQLVALAVGAGYADCCPAALLSLPLHLNPFYPSFSRPVLPPSLFSAAPTAARLWTSSTASSPTRPRCAASPCASPSCR